MNPKNLKSIVRVGLALCLLGSSLLLTSCGTDTPIKITFTTANPLTAATHGVSYTTYIEATGVTGPPAGTYAFSVVSGSLPTGVSWKPVSYAGNNNDSYSYLLISGKPTTTGTYTFIVKAEDTRTPATTATEEYTLTVN